MSTRINRKMVEHALQTKNVKEFEDLFKRNFMSYGDAKIFVKSLKIDSRIKWKKYSVSDDRPNNIPSHPEVMYKKEFEGWEKFLGCKLNKGSEKKIIISKESPIRTNKNDNIVLNYVKEICDWYGEKYIKGFYEICIKGNRSSFDDLAPPSLYSNDSYERYLGRALVEIVELIDDLKNIQYERKLMKVFSSDLQKAIGKITHECKCSYAYKIFNSYYRLCTDNIFSNYDFYYSMKNYWVEHGDEEYYTLPNGEYRIRIIDVIPNYKEKYRTVSDSYFKKD